MRCETCSEPNEMCIERDDDKEIKPDRVRIRYHW
jgi:hypothetical protein